MNLPMVIFPLLEMVVLTDDTDREFNRAG